MKSLEVAKFSDEVAGAGVLPLMVKCVTELPTITEDIDTCVCQLLTTQPGYIAGHLYKANYSSGTWIDITRNQTITLDTTVDVSTTKYQIVDITGEDDHVLKIYWATPDNLTDDPWVRDVVVSKPQFSSTNSGTVVYPESVNDGEVLGSSTTRNEYASNPFITSFINLGTNVGEYGRAIRVFHEFASGYTTYTPCSLDTTTT